MSTEVKVPALGESVTEATLGQWLKKPGDAVEADEPVASLETDKVALEVPSPVDGVMGEQLVAEGTNVAVGTVIARIDENGAQATKPVAKPATTPVNPPGAGENIAPRDAPQSAEAEAAKTD
ncbi:MAG: biotin/lipoyl-containing protein, partial [Sphingosinicella sp.]